MPRPPRLHVDNGTYHVILRGNHRQPIFLAAADRLLLNDLVEKGLRRFDCQLHAYCWMPNHIHAVIQVGQEPLGRFVLWVASQYARKIQRRLDTTGHLFERRHRAILVDASSYLLALIRYVHLNPVRAGLVNRLLDYPWTSHANYLGLRSESWVTTAWGLRCFSPRRGDARRAYSRFIGAGASQEDIDRFAHGGPGNTPVLGDAESLLRAIPPVAKPTPSESLEELLNRAARCANVSVDALLSRSQARNLTRVRAQVANEAIDSRIATVSEVARILRRSPQSICAIRARAVR